MKYFVISFLLIFVTDATFAKQNDSLVLKSLEVNFTKLENQLTEVRRDQLNYKIEKDLLKETYGNNYNLLSLVITIVLAIIGFFGYVGIKDINGIKKEYIAELNRLSILKSNFEQKIKDFDDIQIKYDSDIKSIIKQNEEQNRKIKVLEFKSKIDKLYEEKKYATALENCLHALNIAPNDIYILTSKARIYAITRSYPEAITTYLQIIKLDKTNNTAIFNLAEVYLFNNQNNESAKLVEDNSQYFKKDSSSGALKLFKVLSLLNDNNLDEIINEVKEQIDNSNLNDKKRRIINWDFKDVYSFVNSLKETKEKETVLNYLNYTTGKISGAELTGLLNK